MSTNELSPFTSKGYPYSKDWSSYNTYDMGRAFFSDGFITNSNAFLVFDNQSIFKQVIIKDEPLFYKKKEIPITIYTVETEKEVLDTFKKLEIDYDEIAIFFFKQNNSLKAKINLGDSLLKLSNFQNEREMESKTWFLSTKETNKLSNEFSSKKVISLLNEHNLLFNENDFVNENTNINKIDTDVLEVQLISKLQKGNANNGKRNELQNGMIFGNYYTFKATKYSNKKPKNVKKIKWYIKFHNLTTNTWEEVDLNITGEKVVIQMNNLEMCGRFVYIRAYTNDKKKFAEEKVWMHNRFRWFDRNKVHEEIEDRLINPWKIDQSGTSLCGMACIFYLFAKENPNEYRKFSKELFRKGIAKYNNYEVKPSKEILNKIIDKNGFPYQTDSMPLIDFVTLAGLRNTNNPEFKDGNNKVEAINWPPVMTDLCENFLGFSKVDTFGVYNPIKNILYSEIEVRSKINDINSQIDNGSRLILMIDSDLINDVWDYGDFDLHWVVLESKIIEIPFFDENGKIDYLYDFRVYSWGTNPFDDREFVKNEKTKKDVKNANHRYLKKPITIEHFMNNYNGYIKVN